MPPATKVEALVGYTNDNMEIIRETPKSTFRLYLATLLVCITSIAIGGVLGYTSSAIPSMKEDQFSYLTPDQVGWFGSLATVGAMLGSLSSSALAGFIGRKRSVNLCALPLIAGWIVIITAENVAMLYVGRFLTGFCVGVFCGTVPVYISEISTPNVRGTLGSCFQFFICCGVAMAYGVGIGLNWTWTAVVVMVPAAVLAVALVFIPESPVWLVQKDRTREARKSLVWLRGQTADVDIELKDIGLAVEENSAEKSASFRDIFHPETLKPLSVSVGVMFLQQFSGINAVIVYTSEIFKNAGTLDPDLAALITGLVQVLGTGLSVVIIDRLGRKILLLVSAVGMMISMGVLGAFKIAEADQQGTELGLLPLVCVMVFMVSFAVGFGPIPWLLMSEILTRETKTIGCSIASASNWGFAFVVTKTFPLVVPWMAYCFFTGICCLSILFIVFFIPETRGKSLNEIQQLYS